jgi:hypothetical protein
MSRGHGRVERAILEALRWDKRRANRGRLGFGGDAEMLAHYVKCGESMHTVACDQTHNGEGYIPTRSELESVHRALRNLRKQGLVCRHFKYRRASFITPAERPSVPD